MAGWDIAPAANSAAIAAVSGVTAATGVGIPIVLAEFASATAVGSGITAAATCWPMNKHQKPTGFAVSFLACGAVTGVGAALLLYGGQWPSGAPAGPVGLVGLGYRLTLLVRGR